MSNEGEHYIAKTKPANGSPGSTVLVLETWHLDRKEGKIPIDGGSYLGSGFYKFGVRVRIYYIPKFPVA